MLSKTRTALIQLVLAIALIGFVSGVSVAAPLPPGQGILIVDGNDADSTVTPTVINNGGDYSFGQILGGIFVPIVSEVTALAGGSVVDFAIQDNNNPSTVFSLLNPGVATITGSLETPIDPSNSQNPVVSSTYFNTLFLNFAVGGSTINLEFLNAGADKDGFQAVPVPTSALLFGTGLVGLIGLARRKSFHGQK